MGRLFLSAFVVLLGIGGAFATKATSKKAMEPGYRIDGLGQCVTDGQQCNTTGIQPCQWGTTSVILKDAPDPSNPTECGDPLFKQ